MAFRYQWSHAFFALSRARVNPPDFTDGNASPRNSSQQSLN